MKTTFITVAPKVHFKTFKFYAKLLRNVFNFEFGKIWLSREWTQAGEFWYREAYCVIPLRCGIFKKSANLCWDDWVDALRGTESEVLLKAILTYTRSLFFIMWQFLLTVIQCQQDLTDFTYAPKTNTFVGIQVIC